MRLWLLLVGLLLACGGAGSGSIGGTWSSPGQVAGSGITMKLIEDLGSVSGTGVQKVEAGRDRNFNVAGSVHGHQVSLGIWFQDQATVSFQGTLEDDTLKGTWAPKDEGASSLTFTR